MIFKKEFESGFESKNDIFLMRLSVSRGVFMFFTIVFFVNYFFVGANFFFQNFSGILPYTYVLFVFSFFMFAYFSIKDHFLIKSRDYLLFSVFLVLLVSIFVISLLPFIIEDGILSFIN